ncbi:MAG TPA: hypothetical protein VND65_02205 [Candidatus Binatia bacterium]|nr:hypothetical protein [Candidatus Binatia bacterium]
MGGLDFCGYSWTGTCSGSNVAITACTQSSSPPFPGAIAECFPAVNVANTINGSGPAPGSRSTAAFWAGNSANPENYLYVVGSGDSLRAHQMLNNAQLNTQAAIGNRPATYAYPGASPAISWDNSNPGNGLLWVVDPVRTGSWNGRQNQTVSALDAVLDVYAPIPTPVLGQQVLTRLWSSTSGNGPGAVKYAVPTIANGMVFVAGGAANYAPGPQGATGVNCYPAASGGNSPTCQGLLVVYGKLTP